MTEPAPARQSAPQWSAAAILALVATGTALRIALANYPFWFDEYATLILADQPLSHLWGPWMVRESNPPLFYTLARFWHALVGDSFLLLRLLPIFGSAVCMGLLAIVARRTLGDRAVVPVLMLYALSASAIFIGHQFRGYIFCELGMLISLVGLADCALDRGPAWRNGALYVTGSSLAVYSHDTMLLWPLISGLGVLGWVGLFRRAAFGTVVVRLLLSNLTLLAICGWQIWIVMQQVQAGTTNSAGTQTMGLQGYAFHLSQGALLAYFPWVDPVVDPASRVAKRVMEVALLLALARCHRMPGVRLLFALLCAGVVVIGLVQIVHPMVTDRTIHWLSLFVVLIIGGAIGTVEHRALRLLALGIPAAALTANLIAEHRSLVIEDLRQPLARLDPATAVVLTENSAGTAVFARACRMQFRQPRCPLTIIALDGHKAADFWASGMSPVPLQPIAAITNLLPAGRPIYTMRYGSSHDPLRALGRTPADGTPRAVFEGPFTRSQLLGRTPMPD